MIVIEFEDQFIVPNEILQIHKSFKAIVGHMTTEHESKDECH